MIPDRIIDKALDAWIGDHNCPHPDLIHVYRVLITRSLEAVAADIWDAGADAGETVGYGIARDNWAPRIPNPYRASETA